MFTKIQTELDALLLSVQKHQDIVAQLRSDESNPNYYLELGGRLIGLTEAMEEIELSKTLIEGHILDIIKNTTDGNYAEKVSNLEAENDALRERVKLLKDDLKKYNISKIKYDTIEGPDIDE